MLRIDTHHHVIPPDYRKALHKAGLRRSRRTGASGVEPRGHRYRRWQTSTSVPRSCRCPRLARHSCRTRPMRPRSRGTSTTTPPNWRQHNRTGSGFFATMPLPNIDEAIAETVRALDDLNADGVVLLANNAGTYLGEEGQDALFAALDERSAVVFIHPGELPGPTVPDVPPFAADFLLDTTRAAYLLVCNGIRCNYPNIRFILSHAGGFVPYASHRMAVAIMADTGRSPADVLDDFAASTSTPRCPQARPRCRPCWHSPNPDHITFGSDWPFAPTARRKAVRGRAGDILGNRQRHPSGDRAHERLGIVPPARRCAATHSAVTGATSPPHRQPIRYPRRRSPDKHQVAGFTPGPPRPTARWQTPSG